MTTMSDTYVPGLDFLTREAVATLLWSTPVVDQDGQEEYMLDDEFSADDLDPAAWRWMRRTIAEFIAENREDVLAYVTADARYVYGYPGTDERWGALAHDIILTANRHGAGFWDRGLGDLGDRLTDAAHALGEFDAYPHEGRIHL